MPLPPYEDRISGISTNWEQIVDAHRTHHGDSPVNPAKLEVLRRYLFCVFQYIKGATRDHHAAEDLTQDFALRFLRGDFRKVSPQKGRFRDYLKRSLRNMVSDHFRIQNRKRDLVEFDEPAHTPDELDHAFISHWRNQLLGYAWQALQQYSQEKSNAYFQVLQIRAANQDASSSELAKLVSERIEKNVSADWLRQNLTRARRKFSEFLTQEVAKTLTSQNQDEIDTELSSLGLQSYICN